jgi:predicted DNA repair protein MutK
MPGFLKALTAVGTAAMVWVGGSIIVHGLAGFGVEGPEHAIAQWADLAAQAVPEWVASFTGWTVTATVDGLLGLAFGLSLIPIVTKVFAPLLRMVKG